METATGAVGWPLKDLAALLQGTLDGPPDILIRGPAGVDSRDTEALAFAESDAYLERAEDSEVGAVLISETARQTAKPAIRVASPRHAFARFLGLCWRDLPLAPGVHPTAVVDQDAHLDPECQIGAYAVIERRALIAKGARVYPFAYIGESCVLEENSVVYPHAVLYRDITIGAGSIIHAGAVIGGDGFGFTWNGQRQVKIPQVGAVVIGPDVEIGSCTTIDRATMGQTEIGEGTKLDNLVQIAHNARIGRHTVIAAQAGISGSSSIGDRCTMAGQTATVDHVTIGSDIILTGRAAVSKDLTEPGPYRGAPATPYAEELRLEAAYRRVPQLLKRVRDLERRLAELEGKD